MMHGRYPTSILPRIAGVYGRLPKRSSSSTGSTADADVDNGLSTLGKLFFGSLCAGTFGLGCWQTQRLFEKQQLVKQRQDDLSQPPCTYFDASSKQKNKKHHADFCRVVLTGRFLHEREFLVGPRGPPPGALPDKPGSSSAGMSSAPQGYFVVTPMQLLLPQEPEDGVTSSSSTTRASSTVLVNRGWVPRHMAVRDPFQRQRRPHATNTMDEESPLYQWERPMGTVQVIAIPTKPEVPRFLVAEHNVSERPAKLYWFDWPTMLALGGIQLLDTADGDDNSNTPPPLLLTAVQTDENKTIVTSNDHPQSTIWPVQPTATKVGDFKVSPAVHAGYAFTWFGLSAAGMYMTKKLITRGR